MFNDLILDKMKKVFEYIATLLLLLAVGTSCEEGNDNWKVITAVPTGLYITGDATILVPSGALSNAGVVN